MFKSKRANTVEWVIQFKSVSSVNKSIVNKSLKTAISRSKETFKELKISNCRFRLTESLAGSYLSLSLVAESRTVSKVLKSNEMKLVKFASELVTTMQELINTTLEHCRMSLEIMNDNDLAIIEDSYSKDQKRMLNRLQPFFEEISRLKDMSTEFVDSLNHNKVFYTKDMSHSFESDDESKYVAYQDYASAKLERYLFLKYDSSSKNKELYLKIIRNNLLHLVHTHEEDLAVNVIKDYVETIDDVEVVDTQDSIALVYSPSLNF